MSSLGKAEPIVAAAVTIVGMLMTTWGAFSHTAPLIAPGATLILLGGGWLGNALARQDIRLFSRSRGREPEADGEAG